jgi:diguanylate cyclase
MTILLDLAFLLFAAAGGAAAVALIFWLRAAPGRVWPETSREPYTDETLDRLRELTHTVAVQVDQHAECVEEIQAQLVSDPNDHAAVVSAVAQLVEANERMRSELLVAEDRLTSQSRQLEAHAIEARTDALTQVANRRALDDEVKRCLVEFATRGTPTTLMLLDVDHFKRFNDSFGHQAGDDALKSVARALSQSIGDLGMAARYGGEEFAVILPGLDSAAGVAHCERARQAVANVVLPLGHRDVRITSSAGVTAIQTGDTSASILERADEALYASKNAGRNCGHFHDGRVSRLLRARQVAVPAYQPTADKIGDEWLYETDAATGSPFTESLPNIASRPAFFDELIGRLRQWRRGRTPLALVLVQVDSYARTLSDHGGAAADALLRIAAQVINAHVRDIDHVARFSEDTFAILLPGSLLADGEAMAEGVRKSIERCPLPRKAGAKRTTVTAGVVQSRDGDDLRSLLERARSTLITAVNAGRNRVSTTGLHSRPAEQPAAV